MSQDVALHRAVFALCNPAASPWILVWTQTSGHAYPEVGFRHVLHLTASKKGAPAYRACVRCLVATHTPKVVNVLEGDVSLVRRHGHGCFPVEERDLYFLIAVRYYSVRPSNRIILFPIDWRRVEVKGRR